MIQQYAETPYVRGDGHFSPQNGASFTNLGGGVRASFINKGAAAALAIRRRISNWKA